MNNSFLSDLNSFVIEANNSNSSLEKLNVIKKYPHCKELFQYTYDVTKYQYGVTSANIKKLKSKFSNNNNSGGSYDNIVCLLNDLNKRIITGHDAIKAVLYFISQNSAYEDLILNIIDRNLKTRTDIKLFNKVYPKLITQFDVALCNDFDEYDPKKSKLDFKNDVWVVSRKLDGCRCVIVCYDNGDVKAFSRNGKEFFTLGNLINEYKKLNHKGFVFDGEICIVDDQGNENFQEVMKVIRKKDYTIPSPKHKVFDCIPLQDFFNQSGTTIHSDRQKLIIAYIPSSNQYIEKLSQTRIDSYDQLEQLRQDALTNKWEGLILRKSNIGYEGKRNNNLLKCKFFKDAEFIVKDVEMGPFRYIAYDVNGKSFEKEEETLSAIMVEYEGGIVRCGSGFSLEERQHYYKNPNELIGKQVTIKYFECTVDQTGKKSLRFPTLKKLWIDGNREEEE